jgi:hypothetical protein
MASTATVSPQYAFIKSLHESTNSISGRSTAGVCRLRLAQLYCSIRSRDTNAASPIAQGSPEAAGKLARLADRTPSHWSILFLRFFTANRKKFEFDFPVGGKM